MHADAAIVSCAEIARSIGGMVRKLGTTTFQTPNQKLNLLVKLCSQLGIEAVNRVRVSPGNAAQVRGFDHNIIASLG